MTSGAPGARAGASVPAASYGGFLLGDMHLALPMTALREVLALGPLRALPCPVPCVLGGVALRGVVIPVIDLRILLGAPAGVPDGGHANANIVIMVHGGRLVGLLAHAVTGIFTGANDSLVRSRGGETPAALFAGSIRRDDDDKLVSLLSPEALCALPDLPLIEDSEPERMQTHETAAVLPARDALAADNTVSLMLLRCGSNLMVIEALCVQSTLVDPVLEASALAMGACRGVLEHVGRHIAAVDLSALCGFPRGGNPVPGDAFVLACDGGRVALLVDEVIDIVRVPAPMPVDLSSLVPSKVAIFTGALPAASLGPPYCGKARYADAHFLWIDGARLASVPELVSLAGMNTPAAAHATADALIRIPGTARAPSDQRPMICYEMLGAWATPLDQVAEILPFRAENMTFGSARTGGLVMERGRSIAVISLGQLLDPAYVSGTEVAVLVVQSGANWVGFAVTQLLTIELAHWEPELPPTRGRLPDVLARTLGQGKLALFGAGPTERMLRVLDLALMARIVLEEGDCLHEALEHDAGDAAVVPG